jgi:NADPH:quinone reductase-like Zn-dependent oxidoreductase
VGRAPDGTLRYFILPDTTMGAMAEQTVVNLRRSVVLPEDSDPVLIAAAMNPAMSSWVALRRRVTFPPGQRVLVLAATGNAGKMAVQVAKPMRCSPSS